MSKADDFVFHVQCTGQIESGNFGSLDSMYCRYAFQYGNDWTIVAGLDFGVSQISRRLIHIGENLVWNFPIDVTFKSTNVHGWPRIAVTVCGVDFLGRDVVRGYGSLLVPLSNGQHCVDVDMYVPLATSSFNQAVSWLMGTQPEFFDSKFVCQGEGRDVTRVQHTGVVRVKVNVCTKGMEAVGYSIPAT